MSARDPDMSSREMSAQEKSALDEMSARDVSTMSAREMSARDQMSARDVSTMSEAWIGKAPMEARVDRNLLAALEVAPLEQLTRFQGLSH